MSTPNSNAQISIRITHDFSPNHRLSVGYNFENSTSTNAGVGGITLPEAGYNLNSREDDAIFNDRIIVTPNLVNQLQITLEKDEDVTQSVTEAQSIQVSGSFIGGGAQADLARTENTIHVTEVVYLEPRPATTSAPASSSPSSADAPSTTTLTGSAPSNSLLSPTIPANTPYVFTGSKAAGAASIGSTNSAPSFRTR